MQASSGGLTRTLGSLVDVTVATTTDTGFPGIPPVTSSTLTNTKAVFTPAVENIEYTIQVGQSIDKTSTVTVTTFASPLPQLPAPSTTTGTERHTFVAKETIQLSNGKSYSACRYTVGPVGKTDVTTSWLMVGNGQLLKSQFTANGSLQQTIELKSGTLNGAPL